MNRRHCWWGLATAIAVGAIAYSRWDATAASRLDRDSKDAERRRDWPQLVNAAQSWARRSPGDAEAWIRLANGYSHLGRHEEALASLGKTPVGDSHELEARIKQIDLLFGPLERPADGALACIEVLKIVPDSPIAAQRLISFLALTRQHTALIEAIRAAFKRENEPKEAYVYLFFADAPLFSNGAELNGRWLAQSPESELFEVAQAMFIADSLDASVSNDDREGAERARLAIAKKADVIQGLLRKYPHNAELLAYQLRECLQNGDHSRAAELLSMAPQEAERDNRFWRYHGWVHSQRGDLPLAISSYEQAIQLHPLDWSTRHLLADALHQEKRQAESVVQRELVAQASEIRRKLYHVPSARDAPAELLSNLAEYALACGDRQTRELLNRRLRMFAGARK